MAGLRARRPGRRGRPRVTPEPIEAYLIRLERALRQRGLEDPRIVEEAREHLVDIVAAARQRGLSADDAEREAFERFGAPEIVAAHAVPERDRMMYRVAAVLTTVWHRKWWILTPTVLTAVVTSVMSSYLLPTRYRSDSIIRIVSPLVPAEYVRPTATARSRERAQHISDMVLSRRRLGRIIEEFGLYKADQGNMPLDDLVTRMRRDIGVDLLTSDHAQDDELGEFNVSFVATEPVMAMKVTERLTRLVVEENLRDREVQAEGTNQFIDSQIDDVRRRIIGYEATLEKLRAQNGHRPLSQADLLPYEVLQERYKALLIKGEDARMAAALERRQVGEQYKVFQAPRLPQQPVGPSRLGVNVAGTLAGLALGLVLVGVRGSSKTTSR